MRELEYRLEGLDCASCAVKIEDNLNKIEGISSAELIFTTQKLTVKVNDTHELERLKKEIKSTVNRIEPDVKIQENEASLKNSKNAGELGVLKKHFLLLGLSIIIFAIGLSANLPIWFELLLFGLSYLTAGVDVIYKAVRNIIRGQVFDENFLMSVATIGAFAVKEFPEAAAVMIFFKLGELFQDMAINRSRKSIKALMDIKPDFANLKTAEGSTKVSPADVKIGDSIIVKPGERVPLDGTVLEGSSFIDTSALTGESDPRTVNPGDAVLSGSVNVSGLLTMEVTKNLSQSTVTRILDLVENAASKKAPAENFITKFAKYYTPAVVFAALLIALLPPVITGGYEFGKWIYRALIFLVISCPCALVISIPLSFFGGIGGASKKGILVKGGNFLDALNDVGAVVFDKTGTLTKGKFKVSKVAAENGFSIDEVLEMAALAEAHSNHPIAKSIFEAYGKKIDEKRIAKYEEISGYGIKAVIDGKQVLSGNDRLLHIGGCVEHNTCNVLGTVIYVAVNNTYAGYITISDEVKHDSAKTVSELRTMGISKIIMLSGDNSQTAQKIGSMLGVDEVYSELLPHQKVEQFETIQEKLRSMTKKRKNKLVFVGDGINDAPVLARADIGVSMGALGSDAAIEASDIVLMTDEPFKLVEAIKTARRTRSIVWQNIAFALGAKLIVLILGAGGIATMWEAVFADVGVAIIAVLNAMRMLKN